jgi:hypothetical protein
MRIQDCFALRIRHVAAAWHSHASGRRIRHINQIGVASEARLSCIAVLSSITETAARMG